MPPPRGNFAQRVENKPALMHPAMRQKRVWPRTSGGHAEQVDIERARPPSHLACAPKRGFDALHFVKQPARAHNRIDLQYKVDEIGLRRAQGSCAVKRRRGDNPHAGGGDGVNGTLQ